MRTIRAIGATLMAGFCTLSGAQGASCVTARDMAPLQVAAMQQELMVAALTCHEIGRYNQFVRSRQPELIASDNRLKAYFVRRAGSETAYHTFKTELANDSSLRSIHENASFCAHAAAAFDVSERPIRLSMLARMQSYAIGTSYRACVMRSDSASNEDDASDDVASLEPREQTSGAHRRNHFDRLATDPGDN